MEIQLKDIKQTREDDYEVWPLVKIYEVNLPSCTYSVGSWLVFTFLDEQQVILLISYIGEK